MKDSKNLLIKRPDPKAEFMTPEGCRILEVWNDESDRAVSIARATVAQGVTTKLHRVRGVDERYVITQGNGCMKLGQMEPEEVEPGDVVMIPAGTAMQITNIGDKDLIFYCICSPRFTPDCYESLED